MPAARHDGGRHDARRRSLFKNGGSLETRPLRHVGPGSGRRLAVRKHVHRHEHERLAAPARCARRSSTPTRTPGLDTIAFNIPGAGVHTITPLDARRSSDRPGRDRRLHAARVEPEHARSWATTPSPDRDRRERPSGGTEQSVQVSGGRLHDPRARDQPVETAAVHHRSGQRQQRANRQLHRHGSDRHDAPWGRRARSSTSAAPPTTSRRNDARRPQRDRGRLGIRRRPISSSRLAAPTSIQGNYIGVNAAGTAALTPSPLHDLWDQHFRDGARQPDRRDRRPGARNVIFGNAALLLGTGSHHNTIQGNFIGTNATGTAGFGATIGIDTNNAPHDNLIGGSAAGAGNVISGNVVGILFADGAAAHTVTGQLHRHGPDGPAAGPEHGTRHRHRSRRAPGASSAA